MTLKNLEFGTVSDDMEILQKPSFQHKYPISLVVYSKDKITYTKESTAFHLVVGLSLR